MFSAATVTFKRRISPPSSTGSYVVITLGPLKSSSTISFAPS